MTALLQRYDGLHAINALNLDGGFAAPQPTIARTYAQGSGRINATVHPYQECPFGAVRIVFPTDIMDVAVRVLVGGMGHATFGQRMEKVRRDLERLQDGWCGPDSQAPSSRVLADLDQLLPAIPAYAVMPEVEVEENGAVTFRWGPTAAHNVALAMILRGNGRVLIVTTELGPETLVTSEAFGVTEHAAVARHIESDDTLFELLSAA